MTRFKGLFKKGPEYEDTYAPVERSPRTRRVARYKEPEEDIAIGEALEEIEAEEEIPELGDIEDELIELEGASGLPTEDTSSALLNQISERLNEVDGKMSRVDTVISTIKNESKQFQEQLSQLDEDIRKLLSVYEVGSARFKPLIDMAEEEEEEVIETIDELPPFKPYGSGRIERAPSEGKTIGREGAESATPWEPELSTSDVERQRTAAAEPAEEPLPIEAFKTESPLGHEPPTVKGKLPILTHVNHDYLTLVLVMRWIEFLFERATRDKISLVLDYYKDIGWISDDVKSEVMAYARGEMQDVMKYMAHEEARDDTIQGDVPSPLEYKKVEDWRLSADDHLKSLLFIMKIANINVDKDRLNSLEQMIQKFKESLEGFHGV